MRPVEKAWNALSGRISRTESWNDLDHHVSSNIVYVTPAGRFERAAAMEHIQQLQVEEFSIGDLV